MNKICENVLGLGVSIAVGLVLSAGIVSYTANRIANNKQSVVVKGLAEKEVSADSARWSVSVGGSGKTIAQAFAALRGNRPAVLAFFAEQGFADEQVQQGREVFEAVYKLNKDGISTGEISEYVARQSLRVDSKDVKRVEAAVGQIVRLQENG